MVGLAESAPAGTMKMIVRLYAPAGGTIEWLKVDGEPVTLHHASDHGRPLTRAIVDVPPGQSRTVEAQLVNGSAQTAAGVLDTTPGITSAANGTSFRSAC